jgi:hypothetical protein
MYSLGHPFDNGYGLCGQNHYNEFKMAYILSIHIQPLGGCGIFSCFIHGVEGRTPCAALFTFQMAGWPGHATQKSKIKKQK